MAKRHKKPKGTIFIATPMYGGQCFGFYTQSILRLQGLLQQAGYESMFSFMFNESLIQRARNGLVKGFLREVMPLTFSSLMQTSASRQKKCCR